jgi:hypothetical protein
MAVNKGGSILLKVANIEPESGVADANEVEIFIIKANFY